MAASWSVEFSLNRDRNRSFRCSSRAYNTWRGRAGEKPGLRNARRIGRAFQHNDVLIGSVIAIIADHYIYVRLQTIDRRRARSFRDEFDEAGHSE
jgi:hypothetical protein